MQCVSYCISVSDHNSLGKSSFKLGKCSANDKSTTNWIFFYASAENILIADLAAEKPLLFHIVLVLLALLL